MKKSSPKTAASKKASKVDAEQAMKTAFQQLCHRVAEESKAAREKRQAEKFKQWQGAAKRFKGLSDALRLQMECRNIYTAKDGFTVSFLTKTLRRPSALPRFFASTSGVKPAWVST